MNTKFYWLNPSENTFANVYDSLADAQTLATDGAEIVEWTDEEFAEWLSRQPGYKPQPVGEFV